MNQSTELLNDLLSLGFSRSRLIGKFDNYSEEEIQIFQRWSDSWKGPGGERISEIGLNEFKGIQNPSYSGVINFENQTSFYITYIKSGSYSKFIINNQEWRLSPSIIRELDSGKASSLKLLSIVVEYHFAKTWTLYKWQELVIGKVKYDRHLKGLPPKVKRHVV